MRPVGSLGEKPAKSISMRPAIIDDIEMLPAQAYPMRIPMRMLLLVETSRISRGYILAQAITVPAYHHYVVGLSDANLATMGPSLP